MIPRTHAVEPRLASANLATQAGRDKGPPTTTTSGTKGALADLTPVGGDARLEEVPAGLTGLCGLPGGGAPGDEGVPVEALWAGALELDDEVAEEARVPVVLVALEQLVRLLVCKEVEREPPHRRRVADPVVQDPRVAGRRHRVCQLRQPRHRVQDVVAQPARQQLVRQRVQVQQQKVLGTAVHVAQVPVAVRNVRQQRVVDSVAGVVLLCDWRGKTCVAEAL